MLQAVKLYVGSHYGSMLWDLGCDMAAQYYNAWNTCVKLAWQVPRATRTYIVDHLLSCGQSNARMDILGRFAKFVRGLRASPSMEVAVMCGVAQRDIRSVTGSNIALVRQEAEMDPVHCCLGKLKRRLQSRVASVPDLDRWRLEYLARLLKQRGEASFMADSAEVRRLSTLIDSLCIN